MTTADKILHYFRDINYAYNDCTKYDTLKAGLDAYKEEIMDDIYERLGLIRYDPSKEDESAEDFTEIADIIYVDTDSIKIEKEGDEDGC